MWSTHEATQKIAATRDLPYGSARTAAIEYITRTLEREGPEAILPEAYLNLVEAYVFGQPTPASFAVFSKLLRLYDSRPDYFNELTARTLFWQFKWIVGDLTAYPQISQAQARELLDEMRKRYLLAGMGQSAPDRAEYMWASHLGLDQEAEDWRARWLSHGEDEMDCGSCRVGGILRDHVTDGQFEQALALGVPKEDLCNREPASSHRQLALACLHLGDGLAAGRHLLRARAHSDHYDPDDLGVEFEVLARGQQLEAAFSLLAEHGKQALDLAGDPGNNRNFLRYLVAGLAWALEEHGDMPTGLRPAQGAQQAEPVSRATLRELYDWALKESQPLAQAFDRRAANTRFSEALEQARELPALTALIFPQDGAVEDQAGQQLPPTSFDPVRSYRLAAQVAAEAGQGLAAGLAYAEAAHLLLAAGQVGKAQALEAQGLFEAAWPLLFEGGAAPALLVELLCLWAPVAEKVSALEALEQPVEQLQARVQQLLGSDSPAGLGQASRSDYLFFLLVQEVRARLLLAAQDPAGQQLVDELVEAYQEVEQLERAARLLLLAAQAAAEAGQTERALDRYELAAELFQALKLKKSRAAALDSCIELLRATGQEHRVQALTEGLL